MNPAIVIPCYQRYFSLERLLDSIANAIFPDSEVSLIFSIDGNSDERVIDLANHFKWNFGPKRLIVHSTQLGLKGNIFACAELAELYGSIIILEDDLFVSPYFYEFALNALEFYKEENKVAGISLYNYQVSEFSHRSFCPLDDGSDAYFLQLPSSWGQLFTWDQWQCFRDWNVKNEQYFPESKVPEEVKKWGDNSWKKHFIHYLVTNDLYFAFPRLSLTTNFEEFGVNSDSAGKYQVRLQNAPISYKFFNYAESSSIYDAYYEITPGSLNKWTDQFKEFDYEVDLNSSKCKLTSEYVLTTKTCNIWELSFSNALEPELQNIVSRLDGTQIRFAKVEDIVSPNDLSVGDNKFFVIIPVIDFDEEKLSRSIHSVLANNYQTKKVVLSILEELYLPIYNFIVSTFYQDRFDIQILSLKSGSSMVDCLKNGFDHVKSGIVTWIQPGSQFNRNAFSIANKAFAGLTQINSIFPINNQVHLDNYRFTKETICYFLNDPNYYLHPEMIYFRAGCWQDIHKHINQQGLASKDFFTLFVLALVNELDLCPFISEIGEGRISNRIEMTPLDGALLDKIVRFSPGLIVNYSSSGRTRFKMLKWFSDKGIPLLKRIYHIYYDLPLVLRYHEKGNNVFFSNK